MDLKNVARVLEHQLNISIEEVRKTNNTYFQGKKDALRIALALIYEELGEEDRAKLIDETRKSSYSLQATQEEKLKAVISQAVYVFGDFVTTVFEKKKPDYRTAINAYQWFDWALSIFKEIWSEKIDDATLPEFPYMKEY